MDKNADVIAMLCRRIKMTRIEKNLSQIQLAEISELGIATIKRIELGESITLQTLISVLRGLGELDQLNNLLAHNELKAVASNEKSKRKRKPKKTLVEQTEEKNKEDIVENDFIATQLNNMHWKY